jgi:hypothetical protein
MDAKSGEKEKFAKVRLSSNDTAGVEYIVPDASWFQAHKF